MNNNTKDLVDKLMDSLSTDLMSEMFMHEIVNGCYLKCQGTEKEIEMEIKGNDVGISYLIASILHGLIEKKGSNNINIDKMLSHIRVSYELIKKQEKKNQISIISSSGKEADVIKELLSDLDRMDEIKEQLRKNKMEKDNE